LQGKRFTFYLTLCLFLALPAYYQEGVKVGKGMRQKGEGKGRSWKVKAKRKVER